MRFRHSQNLLNLYFSEVHLSSFSSSYSFFCCWFYIAKEKYETVFCLPCMYLFIIFYHFFPLILFKSKYVEYLYENLSNQLPFIYLFCFQYIYILFYFIYSNINVVFQWSGYNLPARNMALFSIFLYKLSSTIYFSTCCSHHWIISDNTKSLFLGLFMESGNVYS